MQNNETKTPSTGDAILSDVVKSMIGHLVVFAFIVLYVLLSELVASWQKKSEPSSQSSTIGVEFIHTKIEPKPAPAPNLSENDEQPPKQAQTQNAKPKATEDAPVIPEVAKPQPLKKEPVTQRHATRLSSQTKTATSKTINIKKAVGQQAHSESKLASSEMIAKTKKMVDPGVLRAKNAQVLASKETVSAAKKRVKSGVVKSTVNKLSAKEVAQKKAQALKKQKQQQLAKREEEKKRALVVAEQKRLAEAKRVAEEKRLALLEQQRKKEREDFEARTIMRYGQMITEKIQSVALFNPGMDKLSAKLKIQLADDGHVQSVMLQNGSGNASFDRLAINAVYKAAPLPLPDDAEISKQMSIINLVIRPDSLG